MTIEQLKALRDSAEECRRCGFCANVAPSKKEITEVIDELIKLKTDIRNGGYSNDRNK